MNHGWIRLQQEHLYFSKETRISQSNFHNHGNPVECTSEQGQSSHRQHQPSSTTVTVDIGR